ncbi:MAG TPA: hypothetical protein ENI62_01650 [Gammaproteobacteria bacterium]|nr:hypothetical protein [Gammaproteobacteria bacterium]
MTDIPQPVPDEHRQESNSLATIRIRQGWVICIGFSLLFTLRKVYPEYRQVIYLLPYISLVFGILNSILLRKILFDKKMVLGFVIYVVAVILSIYSLDQMTFFSYRDFLIISAVFLTFIPVISITDKMVKILFIVFLINTFIGVTFKGVYSLNVKSYLVDSNALLENDAFQFALFTLYFIYRKDYKWAAISLLMNGIVFKRIAFFALLSSLGTYLYMFGFNNKKYLDKKLLGKSLLMAFAYTLVLYIIAMNIAYIARYVLDYFQYYDISTDYFLKGRIAIQSELNRIIASTGLYQTLFGHGIGAADSTLQLIALIFDNPHNDFLKLQFEYGIVGLVLYVTAIWLILSRNCFGILVFVFSMTLLPTDNTIIYITYQFLAVFLVKCISTEMISPGEHQQEKSIGSV